MPDLSLTVFEGRTADRNPRAMAGARLLGAALADRLGIAPARIGTPLPPLGLAWREELDAARPVLQVLAAHLGTQLEAGKPVLTVLNRCASSLATLPQVARGRPDACVVWFDAHADANTPDTSATGYLGGLVLTGASGAWDSGLGAGMPLASVVLVGSRDIDPAEQALIDAGALRHVAPGPGLPGRLAQAVGTRPVYVHLDCDVLDAGLLPTEFQVGGGLSFDDLRAACAALAEREVVGLELAEFEACWPGEEGREVSPAPLVSAIEPLLRRLGAPAAGARRPAAAASR
ncbi:arginase family protein [Methylibium rhizosphaerae]|uniref:arginase family protein n=1 Tax=Methylibium rhizosphaerae TaxID=2570323 RepID=UPI0011280ADE|nr:arginase family protein [Methylibium rhizosphaerae]